MSAELSRLRWRCRRGTRELDQVLGGWLDQRYPTADDAARAAFARLLDRQDPDLWDWIVGHGRPDDAGEAAVIDDIRARHRA
ncbi:succinate dehydrogenase assembly factor 2 [Dokdonella sp. MW10]|uniref:FAD assembly factor SdhE n=1 Tax=Dokdonella sp. MW10 TaxID=2992926 RepID=UPI003F7FFC2B